MPYWRLFYHISWATKNREPLILEEFESDLHNVIAAKGKELGGLIHAVGGVEDHVHLVASVPPGISLAKFVGQIKGNSSHYVNHALSIPRHFTWQAQYGIVSFGAKQLHVVVRYVRQQRQHHLENTVLAFLEQVGAAGEAGASSTRQE